MSLRQVPRRVRAHIYLYYAGMAAAGLGILGFVLSFWQVGSAAQAAVDVHTDVPWLAYIAIFLFFGGTGTMWYSRRTLDAALHEKMRQGREEALVGRDE